MLLVGSVVVRPLLVEREAETTSIAAERKHAETARSHVARTKRHNEAEALGFERAFAGGRPGQLQGHRDQPVPGGAGTLVSVPIGEIPWMRRNGFAEARDPILKPLNKIECRDAILTAYDAKSEWPERQP